jgi:hypothetical protein
LEVVSSGIPLKTEDSSIDDKIEKEVDYIDEKKEQKVSICNYL